MAIHRFERFQSVRADAGTCWKFFSSPANLARLTPPDLGFEVLSEVPSEIYEGLIIAYRVRPLGGVPLTWVTEITRVRAPHYFCDEQRIGPYRLWHHEHFFTPTAQGQGLELRDLVHYALSPLVELAHPWLVRPRLEAIFDFRRQAVAARFGEL